MLKKLFVHEWHDCWRLMALVNGIVLVLTIIGLFVFRDEFWTGAGDNTIAGVTMVLYLLVYIVSVCALGFVVSLYFYIRFYRNLYTDQGYLMHTLPVTKAQLIWSKAFVGVIWHFISVAVLFLSIFTIMFGALASVDGTTMGQMWQEISAELVLPDLFWVMVIEIILLAIASCFFSLFLGYTAVSIGQLCKKQKVLGAIGAYVVIYIVMQIVSSYATIPLSSFMEKIGSGNDSLVAIAFLFLVLVGIALITAGLYFVNAYIMKDKLNLE